MSAATPPIPAVTPIQSTQLTPKDLSDPALGIVNAQNQTIINALNTILGVGGPTVLASGVDVAGQTITGLAPPQSPTDAISAGHAQQQYSAAAQKSQLDIGGAHALNGLTLLWMKVRQLTTATTATITTTADGIAITYPNGMIDQWALAGPFANISAPSLAVTFPVPFTDISTVSIQTSLNKKATNGTDSGCGVWPTAATTTGFTAEAEIDSGFVTDVSFYWRAVGF